MVKKAKRFTGRIRKKGKLKPAKYAKSLNKFAAGKSFTRPATHVLRDRFLDKRIVSKAAMIASSAGRSKITVQDIKLAMLALGKQKGGRSWVREMFLYTQANQPRGLLKKKKKRRR